MKTIRELKTLDCSGYFFKEMVNILDIEPGYFIINDFKVLEMVQQCLIYLIVTKTVSHTLFLTI